VKLQTISFDMEKEYIRSVASQSIRGQNCVTGTGYIYEKGEEKALDFDTERLFAHSNIDVLDMSYVPYTDYSEEEMHMFEEYVRDFTRGQREQPMVAKKEVGEEGEEGEEEEEEASSPSPSFPNSFLFSEDFLASLSDPEAIMQLPLRKYVLSLPLNTAPKQSFQEEEVVEVTETHHSISIFVFNEEYNNMKKKDQEFEETKSKLSLFSYFVLATVLLYLASHAWTYLTFNYLYLFNKHGLKQDRQKFIIGMKLTLLLHHFGGMNEMERERVATTRWMELHQE
jgi:hypothetical protein